MNGSINRKSFVTALGAAGLGLGLTAAGAGRALAQEATPPSADEQDTGPWEERRARLQEFYADFTAALASELGIASADEVDAGIRMALMAVIDARVGEGELTAGKAEALKALVATADVPFGPITAMMGPPSDRFIHIERGGPMGPGWHHDGGAVREKSAGDEAGESSATDGEEAGQ